MLTKAIIIILYAFLYLIVSVVLAGAFWRWDPYEDRRRNNSDELYGFCGILWPIMLPFFIYGHLEGRISNMTTAFGEITKRFTSFIGRLGRNLVS